MQKIAAILYAILVIIGIITIITGNFNATIIKVEALIFIAITLITRFLPGSANNNNQQE